MASLYTGTGQIQTNAVTGSNTTAITIPASATGVAANPTGQVYNGAGGFLIPTSNGQETSLFIFSGEGGTIAAWAKDSGATAVTAYDDGASNGTAHAVYKGLALGSVNGASFLYATDLHNNKVDVFDTNFAKPAAMQGKFIDPTMPAGFAPFGIAALNGQLYVTYAMQDAAQHDETTGTGLGYVDVFDFSGNFISRFASAGPLNAHWGIALAPTGFGSFDGDLLIGNFGDGTINIFAPNGTSVATDMGPLTLTVVRYSRSQAFGPWYSATATRISRLRRCSTRPDSPIKRTGSSAASPSPVLRRLAVTDPSARTPSLKTTDMPRPSAGHGPFCGTGMRPGLPYRCCRKSSHDIF